DTDLEAEPEKPAEAEKVVSSKPRANGASSSHTAAAEERGIRLVDVSFRYPGQEKWVLRHVDLFIPEGQSVAIVGQNGAGKTTLIKLVSRLYKPTEGRIFLDGKDLEEWDRDELLSRFAVVFQDFNQYQLKFRENVGVGAVVHLEDEERIRRAATRGGAD